jgi:hypothetical protein
VNAWRRENPEPDQPLSPMERAHVKELEAEVARPRMENEFLKKRRPTGVSGSGGPLDRAGSCPLYVRARLETAGLPWTQQDFIGPKAPARESRKSQAMGRFRRWWQVQDSNLGRRSRRFYRPPAETLWPARTSALGAIWACIGHDHVLSCWLPRSLC